jgi:hypothetical protein
MSGPDGQYRERSDRLLAIGQNHQGLLYNNKRKPYSLRSEPVTAFMVLTSFLFTISH